MIAAPLMGPRQVAEAAGVSADTIRHYERQGLIPRAARTRAGYRRYPPETVTRVAIVRRALSIGFSLRDLAAVFRERDRGAAPCRRVRNTVAQRLARVDEEIQTLVKLKTALGSLLEEWDARLCATPDNEQAHLLQSLATVHPPAIKRPAGSKLARGERS
jgi:DNA-binding transcriptional MerR regulator